MAMRANAAGLCLSVMLGAGLCLAQEAPQNAQPAPTPNQPTYSERYCSGFVTDQKVPTDAYLISGEQSTYKVVYAEGDFVYINRGSNQGVREGDRYLVVRAEQDPDQVTWFKWQSKLRKAMGTRYADLGQLQVVNVQPKVSIAKVLFSCAYMQRGDIVRPFVERAAPEFKQAPFEHFAPVSGRPVAMVVEAKDFAQTVGANDTIYVNLGTNQGVKTGDYFRIFRYQGTLAETAPQTRGFQYKLYGFGSTPQVYQWNDLPREVLGEGIVLNASHNSATVLITYTRAEIFAGDYVELE
jgi:hypothetical protein